MSEHLRVGQKVRLTGKDVQGVVAFVGPTNFASDTWIGLKLDEPRGKNNGTVQGVEYFKVSSKQPVFTDRDNQNSAKRSTACSSNPPKSSPSTTMGNPSRSLRSHVQDIAGLCNYHESV